MRIHYRGNVSTEPLSGNSKGIFTEPLPSNYRRDTHTDILAYRLMRGIYEVRR
jgi:hypothetical protein